MTEHLILSEPDLGDLEAWRKHLTWLKSGEVTASNLDIAISSAEAHIETLEALQSGRKPTGNPFDALRAAVEEIRSSR